MCSPTQYDWESSVFFIYSCALKKNLLKRKSCLNKRVVFAPFGRTRLITKFGRDRIIHEHTHVSQSAIRTLCASAFYGSPCLHKHREICAYSWFAHIRMQITAYIVILFLVMAQTLYVCARRVQQRINCDHT